MNKDRKLQKWEKIFAGKEPPVEFRLFVGALISTVGIAITFFLYKSTGFYFPALRIISVGLVSTYCGLSIGLSAAVILSLVVNYLFVTPVGAALNSVAGIEHFFITVTLSIFLSILGSSLRSTFREIVLAKQEEERAKHDAELASTMMEKTLSLVSHDIRNPLTAIKLGVQLIHRTPGQIEKHQPLLVRMMTSLEQADSLIQSLLDVSRIRAGRTLPLDFENCDLSAQIRNLVEDMSLLECDRLNYRSTESIWGAWGVSGIRRVIENLVTNAIKYGAPKTPIDIVLERRNDRAVLTVHNQGGEISTEEQRKLFDAFQRTLVSEKSNTRGWGLGLALVKGIAESHGGTVKVESNHHTGTSFILELPIRRTEKIENQKKLGA